MEVFKERDYLDFSLFKKSILAPGGDRYQECKWKKMGQVDGCPSSQGNTVGVGTALPMGWEDFGQTSDLFIYISFYN